MIIGSGCLADLRSLDRDSDNVLGRVQRFDDQDAAGFRIGSKYFLVSWRCFATAAFVQWHLVLVASAHSGHLGYLVKAHLGTRLMWDR